MKISPWPDFAGNEIAEGDFLIHPDGKKGCVMFDQSGTYEGINRWRMVYDDGEILWLGNQIGDKGRAVRPEAKNMQDAKLGDRSNGWSFIPRRSMSNEIRIKTTYESGQITQDVSGSGPDWRSISSHVLTQEVIRLREQSVREALIRMGWTPPKPTNGIDIPV